MFKSEGGYIGKSMSVRAVKAYQDGEKPLSKWRKKDILEEVAYLKDIGLVHFDMELFEKLNMATLKVQVLTYASWHHTGALYNETEFYCIDDVFIENLTDERILELIEEQKKPKLTADEKAMKKADKEKRQQEKAIKEEREKLFKYQSKFKTMKRFLGSDSDFEELAQIRQEKITEKREELKNLWEKQLSKDAWQWKEINDDDFIESYIK